MTARLPQATGPFCSCAPKVITRSAYFVRSIGADLSFRDVSVFPEIVCPLDGQPLNATAAKLVCTKGGHEWSVDAGIPRMIADRHNYADAFGLQWNTFRKTQLDSQCGTDISLRRAQRCLGPEAWAFLNNVPSEVLEAGCGAGRFTEVLLATRASVTSVDLSTAGARDQGHIPHNTRPPGV